MDKESVVVALQENDLYPVLPEEGVIEKWIAAAAARPVEITVRFVDEAEGLELNRRFRGKDRATNVLTFPYEEKPVAVADLAVCVPVLERQAAEQGKTLEQHLCHLLVHGTLHAQGYDHETDEEAEEMESLETRILESLGFPDPYRNNTEKESDR